MKNEHSDGRKILKMPNIADIDETVTEEQRLQRLRAFDILDSGPESTYDRITLVACEVFGDSEAFLCFVDQSRIFFKSKTSHSIICDFLSDSPVWRTMLLSDQPVVIEDLTKYPDILPDVFTQQFKAYAASPLQTDEGYVLGSLIVMGKDPFRHENTKFKILSELTRLLMDQLIIRSTAKKAFTTLVDFMNQFVHDMKNPLNNILLGAEIIAEDMTEESARKDFSAMIIRNVNKMTGRLNNLLNISKLEADVPNQKTAIEFVALLRSVVRNLSVISQKKYQTVNITTPESIMMTGDTNQIESIFENLISNAIKFSPVNTPIRITVYVEKENFITIIEDQGHGLTKDDHAKLFIRFAKLSAKPTASESSHGLGLSIVKTLVELHHGRIWAESEGKDKGSRFYVSLPKK